MVVKSKEYFEKTRHIKNIDKSKESFLRGQRNARYHEKNYQIKRNLIILSIFSKMVIGMRLKFSTYSIIFTSYPKIYHTLF